MLIPKATSTYLNLRQINQDSLENRFEMIQHRCPTNRNPTWHHFTAALKSNTVTKLSTLVARRANCEEDDTEIITDFEKKFQHVEIAEAVQLDNNSSERILVQFQAPDGQQSPHQSPEMH